MNQPQMAVSNRIDVLDGWRAFSVALVVFGHLVTQSSIAPYLNQLSENSAYFVEMFGQFANLGVCIFFALSGYVICRGLRTEQSKSGRISIQAFYVRRMFRILPPLWLFLATIYILGKLGLVPNVGGIPETLLFITNIPSPIGYWITGHAWSLAYEEQFYLFFPALYVVLVNRRPGIVLAYLAGGFVSLGLLLSVLHLAQWSGFGYYFAFLLGGASFSGLEDRLNSRHLKFIGRFHIPLIAVIFAFWMLVPETAPTIIKATRLVLKPLVGTPLLVVVVCASPLLSSPVTRLFSRPRIAAAGRISYGIYLWQQLFLAPFAWAGFVHYCIGIPLLYLVALGSYKYMEQPLIAIGARISNRLRVKNLELA